MLQERDPLREVARSLNWNISERDDNLRSSFTMHTFSLHARTHSCVHKHWTPRCTMVSIYTHTVVYIHTEIFGVSDCLTLNTYMHVHKHLNPVFNIVSHCTHSREHTQCLHRCNICSYYSRVHTHWLLIVSGFLTTHTHAVVYIKIGFLIVICFLTTHTCSSLH
jgi:hypothetical protein